MYRDWNLVQTGQWRGKKNTLLRVIPTMTFIHFLTGKSWGILSDISSGILFGILSGILSDISSYMRSGREHLAWILAVEVRQGTLGVDGRGWGPAGNTGRGWSWLRSGREHWAWMVVVGRGRRGRRGQRGRRGGRGGLGGRGGEEEEEDEEEATDIKSNNPHLAGGEQSFSVRLPGKYRDFHSTLPSQPVDRWDQHLGILPFQFIAGTPMLVGWWMPPPYPLYPDHIKSCRSGWWSSAPARRNSDPARP